MYTPNMVVKHGWCIEGATKLFRIRETEFLLQDIFPSNRDLAWYFIG